MRFYLGTHRPMWLEQLVDVPLFVSRRTLEKVKRLPRATTAWALDSGGFTELSMRGGWTMPAREYATLVRRYRDEIGLLEWAAPQDWMCEPAVLKETGLDVDEHQRRTVANLLELRAIAPDLPWVPVLQGWSLVSYWRCAELYEDAGIKLAEEPLVGVGTVCRRQATASASALLATLAADGLRLHGFGFKSSGLRDSHVNLASADSLAWSLEARYHQPMAGCVGHVTCANCLDYALDWRDRLLSSLEPKEETVTPVEAQLVLSL